MALYPTLTNTYYDTCCAVPPCIPTLKEAGFLQVLQTAVDTDVPRFLLVLLVRTLILNVE